MLIKTTTPEDASPFHSGEKALQERVGKRAKMETFGRRAIRSFLLDQHREFFSQLPFLVAGSVDAEGWPWASIISGKPGFLTSPDSTTLHVNAVAAEGDPLQAALKSGASLGLLGIEIDTRRRNRMNGRVVEAGSSGFTVNVDQSFGNCPQYIQTRTVDFVREPGTASGSRQSERFTTVDDATRCMIEAADTFFVSSYVQGIDRPESEGVDVSHRGGRPGFVKVEGNTLTIPDYSGNSLFNTLGNFLVNPKAGLVFADFSTGDLLMMTGSVDILWEDNPEVKAFAGAERAWRVTIDHGMHLRDALPFRSTLEEYAPTSLITGDWVQANAALAAEAKRDTWRPYRVARIEDVSSVIRSFYLEPADGDALLSFEAGQFLTIRVTPENAETPATRTYTVSSAPGDPFYRLSVKRESDGLVSRHLHEVLEPGDVIEAVAPRGDFFIDAKETRPAVLLAGGVGVTPMISMAHHIAKTGLLTRQYRPLTVFHAAQTTDQRAFASEFQDLEKKSNGAIRYHSYVSQLTEDEKPGRDVTGVGHLTADILRQFLALDDYDFYLCGPGPFMQTLYNALLGLGVRDARIFAETFGPASLIRRPDEDGDSYNAEVEADNAIIKFTESGFEQQWNQRGETLLETAEAHGLAPDFSCRSGSCGTCAVKLKSGSVAYRTKPSATHAKDEVLICCAVPAKGCHTVEIEL